jgi:phenylalanyl-tRNA synthetase alpha chain
LVGEARRVLTDRPLTLEAGCRNAAGNVLYALEYSPVLPYTLRMDIKIDRSEEARLRAGLETRTDVEAARMKRYLMMPDLSRTPGSPLHAILERVQQVPSLAGLDTIEIPEIVPADISFDLFDFPKDHVARSASDTYYADDKNILRTHNTVSWYYYLHHPDVIAKVARGEHVGALCFGKVYRKDEIDRRHMNVFHQIDGWKLTPNTEGTLPLEELKRVLSEIVETVFGKGVEYRFLEDTFPYTDPSTQIEVMVNGEWVEILGAGMVKPSVLSKMGIEGYNGWAFGFGIERLAILSMKLPDIRLLWSDDARVKKQLVLGTEYTEVSKYPPIVRDISFIVPKTFVPNEYFDLVRETAPGLIEEVSLLDTYENDEKFGADKRSYAYRVTYRSIDRTLTGEEIDTLHTKLEEATRAAYGATIR